MLCSICPRRCGIDRTTEKGYCKCGEDISVAKIMLHKYEEPVISGKSGSGAIFFGGCNLRCVYCQNADISQNDFGQKMTVGQLSEEILKLSRIADNINLITAAHFSDKVREALSMVKSKLSVPVIYNTSGYESVDAIKSLEGLVDVYLPDFKYFSPKISYLLSSAKDYAIAATAAIDEMVRQQPKVIIEDGLIRRGVIIRHLVLPGFKEDSLDVINLIADKWHDALISLMRQYTPDFNRSEIKSLSRRLTAYEYQLVLNRVMELNLNGYFQMKGCETNSFTPRFNTK